MKIDTATIVVISIVIDYVLVLILLHTWRTRTTYPGFTIWIAGTACWSLGSTLNLLMPALQPQFIPKIIGNTLIFLHPVLLYEGIIQFHDIRRRWWGTPLNCLLVLAGLFYTYYFTFISGNLRTRVIGISLLMAILFARICIEPLFHATSRRFSMQWLLSTCLLPLVLMLFTRAWINLSVSPVLTFSDMITQEVLLRWIIFYGIIVEVVIAYSYLSLTSDRVEEELRKVQIRERNISEAQRQFFGMVTHEFKTPLAVINRSVQMIAFTSIPANEALTKRVTTIREQSTNLIELLDACMNDAVLARGELDLSLTEFDLNTLLHKARDHFSEVFPERVVEFILPDRPQLYHGDERLLFLLAVNLIDNAIKFSTLPVSVCLECSAGFLRLTVKDSGVGIPALELPNIGDRTFRATSAKQIPGSGIGLHTVRLIARLHHGSISIDSLHGDGTSVTVTLPHMNK